MVVVVVPVVGTCRMLSDGDSDGDGIPPMIEIPP